MTVRLFIRRRVSSDSIVIHRGCHAIPTHDLPQLHMTLAATINDSYWNRDFRWWSLFE